MSFNLQTTQYAHDVLDGKIIASNKVKLACQRHLNDLERQGTEDFPYIFNEEVGYRPIQFIEKFCKPSKGAFDKLTMQPFQHFIIGSLYGWLHKDTGLRRFREALIFMSRKNGKSAMVSGLANFAVSKDREKGAEVYVLSNSKQQARIIFEECAAMIKSSPALSKHFRVLRDSIHFDKTFSKIEARASDSEKLDGLNAYLNLFDEIHEFKNYKLVNVMKNSTMAREQPLTIYITTAGYQLDGFLIDYYEKASNVLNQIIQDDRAFFFMAEIDEEDKPEDIETNPDILYKANPNLDVTIKKEEMIEEWKTRKQIPAERNDFITKRLNVFVQSDEQSFLDYSTLKKNDKVIKVEELHGMQAVGGFDLSSVDDFTSANIEIPILNTGEIFVLSHSWIPKKKLIADKEKIPFREWEQQGLLTISNKDYIEYEDVLNWFIEQSEHFDIDLITYDPANAFRLVEELKAKSFNVQPVRQGSLTLSPALKDLKQLFFDGKVIYNNNPLLKWYINNVKLVEDRNGNWLPTKLNKNRKIDGFASMLNSHTEVMKRMVSSIESDGVGFISDLDFKV